MVDIIQKKCALVTGASRGIGRAISLQLSADHGLHILVNYSQNERAAQETAAIIREMGGTAELVQFQVENASNVSDTMDAWFKNNPEAQIHVLVNNAGITRDGLFYWMQEKEWDDVISVSLKGMFNVTQSVLKKMMREKTGRIINITSFSGLRGVAGQTNYSAAKAAMIGVTRSLAQETGRRGITVNAVAPGFIETDMTQTTDKEKYLPYIAMGRFGKAEEVAHLVSFLASDKAAYINGEILGINGGMN